MQGAVPLSYQLEDSNLAKIRDGYIDCEHQYLSMFAVDVCSRCVHDRLHATCAVSDNYLLCADILAHQNASAAAYLGPDIVASDPKEYWCDR